MQTNHGCPPIKEQYGMFTLYKLTDIKKRLHDAQRILTKNFGNNTNVFTIQTDVTQMYTNLNHEQIRQAIIWMCDRARRKYNKHKRKTKHNPKFIILSRHPDENSKKYTIRWSHTKESEMYITTTLDEVMTVVDIDLKYTYQTRGSDIFLQKHGCPIGGYLSAIYANVKCAFDEFNFMKNLGTLKSRIYGIRQMDDLILWIAYDRNETLSANEARSIRKQFLQPGPYKGGLVLEMQEYEVNRDGSSIHKFAGTLISVCYTQGRLHFNCQPLNKNSQAIAQNKAQVIPRFIHKHSYVPDHYKKGMQITTYIRLFDQSSNADILIKSMIENAKEMYSLGYDTIFLLKALIILINKNNEWSKVTNIFINKLLTDDLIVGNLSRFHNLSRWIVKNTPTRLDKDP